MKKTLLLIFFILGCLFCKASFAENFYIENYVVRADVGVDKSVYVYEEISVYFTNPSHGIYRTIPLNNDSIEELYVSEKYTRKYSSRELMIKIGDPDRLISGAHKYTISYKLRIYDRLPEFYYNLIGTDWKVPMNFVSFAVRMPKNISADKVGLSVGKYGTAGFDGEAEFNVKDNIIYGNTKQVLQPYNAITLRVEVPDDYFVYTPDERAGLTVLGILVLTFLSFVMWFAYGKDGHVVPVVSFQPPPDISCADAELILREKSTKNALVAMIIQAAEKGYLQIESNLKNFTLYKKKEYDGTDTAEMELLSALFSEGSASVSKSKLENSKVFYKDCQEVLKILKGRRHRFFTKSSLNWFNRFLMLLFVLGVAGLSIFALMNYRISPDMVLCLAGYGFLLGVLLSQKRSVQFLSNILLGLCFFLNLFPQLQYLVVSCTEQNLKVALFGAACFVITLICLIELPKLNFYGQQVKGHLKGLKKFIEVAEKPRLEKMVNEDPKYFYKILPYAYILGVSDKWIKQFESIMVRPVEEFGSRPFTTNSFNNFTRGFVNTTIPSIQNGGISRSSGGGGFSGGGHGGGGGGSW